MRFRSPVSVLQVKSWGAFQASHRLEGPWFLRRNYSPHFMTLETRQTNEARKACHGAMTNQLVGGVSRLYHGAAAMNCPAESQAADSQQQTGNPSSTEGDQLLLSAVMARKVRAWDLNGSYRRMNRACEWDYTPRPESLSA